MDLSDLEDEISSNQEELGTESRRLSKFGSENSTKQDGEEVAIPLLEPQTNARALQADTETQSQKHHRESSEALAKQPRKKKKRTGLDYIERIS